MDSHAPTWHVLRLLNPTETIFILIAHSWRRRDGIGRELSGGKRGETVSWKWKWTAPCRSVKLESFKALISVISSWRDLGRRLTKYHMSLVYSNGAMWGWDEMMRCNSSHARSTQDFTKIPFPSHFFRHVEQASTLPKRRGASRKQYGRRNIRR